MAVAGEQGLVGCRSAAVETGKLPTQYIHLIPYNMGPLLYVHVCMCVLGENDTLKVIAN